MPSPAAPPIKKQLSVLAHQEYPCCGTVRKFWRPGEIGGFDE
jgi:hypothetical protein